MSKDLYFNILGEVSEHTNLRLDDYIHFIGAYALIDGNWYYCKEEPKGNMIGWWSWQEENVPAEIRLKALIYQ